VKGGQGKSEGGFREGEKLFSEKSRLRQEKQLRALRDSAAKVKYSRTGRGGSRGSKRQSEKKWQGALLERS